MRHLRVVAVVALTAAIAAVAVPDPAGPGARGVFDTPDPDLSQLVEVAAAVRGTSMTSPAPDPGLRSAGTLDHGSTLFEPAERTGPPQARPDAAQPAARARSFAKNPWHLDEVSWYGPGFYGNGTACGQVMTKGLVGVAHRSLPCGTKIQFRNDDGSIVTAKVVDRGPYVSGRRWDLTRGLCKLLDHCYTGTLDWRYAPAD